MVLYCISCVSNPSSTAINLSCSLCLIDKKVQIFHAILKIIIGGIKMNSIMFLMHIALTGLGIYCLALFKLVHRGIKALDIYINKNSNGLQ